MFHYLCDCQEFFGGPNGIRTRVTDVRGQCPRPLDDGTFFKKSMFSDQLAILNEQKITANIFYCLEFGRYVRKNTLFKLTHNLLKIKDKKYIFLSIRILNPLVFLMINGILFGNLKSKIRLSGLAQ